MSNARRQSMINALLFRERDTLSLGTTLSKLFLFPSEKGCTLKGKSLLPLGSKLFPFRVYHFQKGLGVQASKQKEESSPLT